MLADYDYENRLIERITVREATARLDQRARRCLYHYFRCGETYREIGCREGLSPARVQQIIDRSIRKTQARIRKFPPTTVKPETPAQLSLPADFDKAAFLEHMRGLIRRRAEARAYDKECAWQREMGVMDHFVRMATPEPPPAPIEIWQRRAAAEAQARREAEFRAQFYENERREWVGCLLAGIAECEGTPCAVLIPQMRADIANIESQPPGALPWRFDREAFKRHFESFKAKVGVPHG